MPAMPALYSVWWIAHLAGRHIQSCGYTYIPETHISTHLPHRAKALSGSRTTEPYNSPSLALPFALRVCCDGRPRRDPVPFAFGRAVRNEIHIKQNRSDRCNAGPRFAPCLGLPGVLDLSCLPPFRLLPTSLAAGCYGFQPPYAPAYMPRISLCGHVYGCVYVCLPSPVEGRRLPLRCPLYPLSQKSLATAIGLSLLHVQTRAAELFLVRGSCREAFMSGWDEFSVRQ